VARIIWTEPALLGLEEIAEYISLDKPLAAKRFVKNVFAKVERLERFPSSGKRLLELRGSPYREVVVPPCRVLCRVDGDEVFIVYLLRSEKLLTDFLIDD
jgi:toxin ParE1/3/4